MMRMLARIMGIGIETADMLVHEVFARRLTRPTVVAFLVEPNQFYFAAV